MDFDLIVATGMPGWLEMRLHEDGTPRVLVKLERRDERPTITRLVIAGELDSATLRALPMGRLHAALSHPQHGMPVTPGLPADVVAELSSRDEVFPEILDMDRALEQYLARSAASVRRPARRRRGPARKPLTRPDGSDPEGFSRRVAEAYGEAVLNTSKPATVLAAEAGVPVTTVHRWIREARQRGLLGPARKGAAG